MKAKRIIPIIIVLFIGVTKTKSQNLRNLDGNDTISLVDFEAFEKLTAEVREHRKDKLINLNKFLEMSKQPGTVILDTRSDEMYKAKHVKGAINLNFSDFSHSKLLRIIPEGTTQILIYCNNNFKGDPRYLFTKALPPKDPMTKEQKPLTLALNIPTYINLYGYGYKNVYELSELVSVADPRIEFEGTAVK